MRCSSICNYLIRENYDVIFAVSDMQSLEFVEKQGHEAVILDSNFNKFLKKNGEDLADYAISRNASIILVDSYAVTYEFFLALADKVNDHSIKLSFIDDCYSYANGFSTIPNRYPVDLVVNYTFGFDGHDYRAVYDGYEKCLIGPKYAPIRKGFNDQKRQEPSGQLRILVTTGSTNPNKTLERIVSTLMKRIDVAKVQVIVGASAVYEGVSDNRLEFLFNVSNMSELMLNSTFAISAGGSTLYELSATGTPTIVLPIFENQLRNTEEFLKLDLGLGVSNLEWTTQELDELIGRMMNNESLRNSYSEKMRRTVDGLGAKRVADALLHLV